SKAHGVFTDAIWSIVRWLERNDIALLNDEQLDRLRTVVDADLADGLRLAREYKDAIPPWVWAPGSESTSSGAWRQGAGELWLDSIWLPFWQGLTVEQRVRYVERWKIPENWTFYPAIRDGISPRVELP